MPLIRKPGPDSAGARELVSVLVEELLHGEEPGRPDNAPFIIIEPSSAGRESVTVIWDNAAWHGLSREDWGGSSWMPTTKPTAPTNPCGSCSRWG